MPDRERLTAGQGWLAAIALVSLLGLLGGVAVGYLYAVEAAAMGAFALLAAGLLTGRLHGAVLNKVLNDAIALTGALFSLLLAAATFTMVLRLLGTADRVGKMVSSIPGGDIMAVAVVLGVLGISAFVLDAFEKPLTDEEFSKRLNEMIKLPEPEQCGDCIAAEGSGLRKCGRAGFSLNENAVGNVKIQLRRERRLALLGPRKMKAGRESGDESRTRQGTAWRHAGSSAFGARQRRHSGA